jgi:hypothetical protein
MLFRVYIKLTYEMLSCCKVIHGLQNIFKLLTDDSTTSNQKTKTNKLKALEQQPSQHNLNALDAFDLQPEAAPLANTGTGSDIRVMMALRLLVTGDDQWKDLNLW